MEKMMADLAAHGLNTVRTFHVYAVGERGILTSSSAREISPEYLKNVIHLLRAAQRQGIHVIFTWDSWLPDSDWWSQEKLAGEEKYHFNANGTPSYGINNFYMTLPNARVRAHEMTALVDAIRQTDSTLLPVVMA